MFSEPSRRLFFLKTVLPIFLVAILANVVASALLLWAAREADDLSIDRQQRLVDLIVSQSRAGIAHDQESVTVWDDAVKAVRTSDSAEWIDVNLGTWMATYFGHDQAFVLNPSNDPIYAFANAKVADARAFETIGGEVLPLVEELRGRLRAGDMTGVTDRVLTIGVSDFVLAEGRPAIVSVKPIVSDTGEIEQTPGTEYLHIAVRFLDQSFVADLARDYMLDQLRFDRNDSRVGTEASSMLVSSHGQAIGYFIWQPYLPGAAVLMRVGPVLIAIFLIGMVGLALLLAALRRRSLNLSLSEATVRHLAHHDLLTGLPNRAQFATSLDAALRKRKATGESMAVLYLDLDRFKQVNDTFGHPVGDQLLSEFADRLRRLTREGDTIARIGGDEFTILARRVESPALVERLCERIIETTRHPFSLAGTQVFVGVSVGVALIGNDATDRVELTRRADVALYNAKRAGRSAFALYDKEMDSDINARRDLERDLRSAFATQGQLQVHYQPLFSTDSQRLTGLEALVRWSHPVRGWVPPDLFIPLAEEIGLIEKLGAWVLHEVCSTAATWPVDTIAINVSAIELRSPNFAVKVANTLMATGMNPRRLEFEVTESAISDKGGEWQKNMTALRELGIRFALDDFGTGFSSLGRLQQFDVDRIKIDRSFVQGFGTDNGDEAIVKAIVDLARATRLKTTAEGVETAEQSEYLKTIGCDDLQGFLLSRPIPADEVEKLWTGEASSRSNA